MTAMFGFGVAELLVILLIALPLLLVGVCVVGAAAFQRRRGSADAGDLEVLRSVQNGLQDMERRIEALEIILADGPDRVSSARTSRNARDERGVSQ